MSRVVEAVKLKMMTFDLTLLSMITSVDGREMKETDKEAIPVSGLDELVVVGILVCIAAIALWELGKTISRFIWRQHKTAKKADRLNRVRKLAAEAANKEVSKATASSSSVACEPAAISPLRLRARRNASEEESPTLA